MFSAHTEEMASSSLSSLSSLLFSLPFTKLEAPKDSEGFIISFSLSQKQEAREFFENYGFVVFKDILSEEEADLTLDEIWDTLKANPLVKRHSVESWDHFPKGGTGVIGHQIAAGRQAWNIRQHPRVYEAYQTILQEEELLASLDRYGFMRPTKSIRLKDGSRIDKPEWKTVEQWFHFDLNPWTFLQSEGLSEKEERRFFEVEPGKSVWEDPWLSQSKFISENNNRPKAHYTGSFKVQGLVALLESRENTGGFVCVPGFHKYLPKWIKKHPQRGKESFVPLSAEDPDILPNAQRITMKKGSLVIWNSELPHCNFPNESDQMRACCYVKMFPRKVLPQRLQGLVRARALAIRSLMPKEVEVSEIGTRVFGFDAL